MIDSISLINPHNNDNPSQKQTLKHLFIVMHNMSINSHIHWLGWKAAMNRGKGAGERPPVSNGIPTQSCTLLLKRLINSVRGRLEIYTRYFHMHLFNKITPKRFSMTLSVCNASMLLPNDYHHFHAFLSARK